MKNLLNNKNFAMLVPSFILCSQFLCSQIGIAQVIEVKKPEEKISFNTLITVASWTQAFNESPEQFVIPYLSHSQIEEFLKKHGIEFIDSEERESLLGNFDYHQERSPRLAFFRFVSENKKVILDLLEAKIQEDPKTQKPLGIEPLLLGLMKSYYEVSLEQTGKWFESLWPKKFKFETVTRELADPEFHAPFSRKYLDLQASEKFPEILFSEFILTLEAICGEKGESLREYLALVSANVAHEFRLVADFDPNLVPKFVATKLFSKSPVVIQKSDAKVLAINFESFLMSFPAEFTPRHFSTVYIEGFYFYARARLSEKRLKKDPAMEINFEKNDLKNLSRIEADFLLALSYYFDYLNVKKYVPTFEYSFHVESFSKLAADNPDFKDVLRFLEVFQVLLSKDGKVSFGGLMALVAEGQLSSSDLQKTGKVAERAMGRELAPSIK